MVRISWEDIVPRRRCVVKPIDPISLLSRVRDLDAARLADAIEGCLGIQTAKDERTSRDERGAPDSGSAMNGDGFPICQPRNDPLGERGGAPCRFGHAAILQRKAQELHSE